MKAFYDLMPYAQQVWRRGRNIVLRNKHEKIRYVPNRTRKFVKYTPRRGQLPRRHRQQAPRSRHDKGTDYGQCSRRRLPRRPPHRDIYRGDGHQNQVGDGVYSDTYDTTGRRPPDGGHAAGRRTRHLGGTGRRRARHPRLPRLLGEPPRAVYPRLAGLCLAHGIEPLDGRHAGRSQPAVAGGVIEN